MIVVVLLLAWAAADVERGVPLPAAAPVCVCVPSLSDKIMKKKKGRGGRADTRLVFIVITLWVLALVP